MMINLNLADLASKEIAAQNGTPTFNRSGEGNVPSVLTMAQAELADLQSDDLAEAQEDLGFALGGRIKDLRRGKEEETGVRGRVLMHKLVAEVAMVEQAELDNQLDDGSWQQSPQLLAALQAEHPEPGMAALQLAGWLAHRQLTPKLRSQLEGALATLLTDEDTALSLFGALEFGVVTPGLRQELVRLYQRATAPRQKLSQWLALFGDRQQRGRKLRTMLRLLAYELSASGQPIVGSHLAAVIGDLRQLLRILGLEAYCDQTAAALALPMLEGETLLALVVQLIEQIWINADGIEDLLPSLAQTDRYRVTQALGKLVQLLPDDCFNDADHRTQLEEAIWALRDRALE
ncbi:TyeA family type III secretion system gatekeeper subunit [Aeromonas jandaei]|uniref:TyeA family type III secretion system gatekeeper subunit n=1 Tax=Aeromonas jandaei TaxID=650 RepID=UPI001F010F59|nr:TyeA family type III secretion system gatekeeper subunit [Aeromonas jandaei]